MFRRFSSIAICLFVLMSGAPAATGATTSSAAAPTDRAAATDGRDGHGHLAHDHLGHDHGQLHGNDPERGMVFDGLEPGTAGGPCAGTYQPRGRSGHAGCSHGPDPAPDDVDVRDERSTEELARATTAAGEPVAGQGAISCIDDGTSGNRVQAIYAVAADRTNRYGSIAPLIAQWAAAADGVFSASASHTGGDRHVRWVTDPACSLSVLEVVVSPTGDDNISNLTAELEARGYNRADRKYLIWTDATVYCGIAYIINDDQPGATNSSNGRYAGYARVDSGCWGRTSSTEAHELMHTLGGVQRSAPHATGGYHCTDEYDRMCYNDGGAALTYPCATSFEATFDCGHDDYFHTSPPAGSYLATHWNTANSSFLTGSTPTAPDTTPPPTPTGLTAGAGDLYCDLSWTAVTAPDLGGYRVLRDGVVIATTTTPSHHDAGLTNGVTYAYSVQSFDQSGNSSAPSAAVNATPAGSGSTAVATLSGRLSRKRPTADLVVEVGAGPTTATVTGSTTTGTKTPASGPTLTLTLLRADGQVVAARSGSGSIQLDATLAAGTYRWRVGGEAGASFALEVEHVSS